MSQKRQQEDGKARLEGTSSEDKRQKLHSPENGVLDVMRLRTIQHLIEPVLEPLIRKVVKEEVELALQKYFTNMKWNCGKDTYPAEARSMQLHFFNNLSLPVFTGTRIEGEDCTTLKIAIYDAVAQQVVSSGPESSAKVEIVVLEGDFDSEGVNWTPEEFKNNVVKEREGKKPLLSGDTILNLKEGIVLVGEIFFTDNSSWTRSRKFRLGARVVDQCEGVRIREAKSESFIVRDHRGELYKKHHPPVLSDEVWRLEKIGKDGAFHKRLSKEKVNTVKDFLILFYLDPTRLRNILGSGMSAKMWDVTVDHARTCELDKKLCLYCPPKLQEKTGVVFNTVGQVTGLLSECAYVPIDNMSEAEKTDAHNLVISAFEHGENIVSIEDEASLVNGSVCLSNVLYPSSVSQPSDVMPLFYSLGGVSNLDDFGLYNIGDLDLRMDQTLSFEKEINNILMCDTEGSITRAFSENDHLQYFDVDCALESENSSWEVVQSSGNNADVDDNDNGRFLLAHSAQVANDKAQRRWKILFSVLRWFSIRRIVAKRTTNVK